MAKPKLLLPFFLKFAVVVSVFGFVSIPMLLSQAGNNQIDFLFSKPLIGLLYAVICVVGVLAVFYPKKCEQTFMFRKQSGFREQSDRGGLSGKLRFRGHHPDCEEFSGNRITVRNVVLCAACMGMLFGAAIALIGAILYFFVGFITLPTNFVVFFVGYGVCMLGLVQYKFRGWFKLIVNALFVVGSFVTLVSADLLGKSLLIDLYVLGLILFLLLARILFSQWNNKLICFRCEGCK